MNSRPIEAAQTSAQPVIGSTGADWIAVGPFQFAGGRWEPVSPEYANDPDITVLYRKGLASAAPAAATVEVPDRQKLIADLRHRAAYWRSAHVGDVPVGDAAEDFARECDRAVTALSTLIQCLDEALLFLDAMGALGGGHARALLSAAASRLARPTPAAAAGVPPGYVLVPREPTPAMVQAYLTANEAYWKRTDELPKRPDKWRTGTPTEATVEGYRAMLAASGAPAGVSDALLRKARDYIADREGFEPCIEDRSAAQHLVAEIDRSLLSGVSALEDLDSGGERAKTDSGDVHPAAGDAERAFASPLPSLSQTDRSALPREPK
jgi:hypothetical protein